MIHLDHKIMCEQFGSWKRYGAPTHCISDYSPPVGCVEESSRLISDLVRIGAWPDTEVRYHGRRTNAIDHLEANGLIQCSPLAPDGSISISLTAASVPKLRSAVELAYHEPPLTIRRHLPHEKMSCFELLVLMNESGWTWKKSPTQAKKKQVIA